MFPFLVGDIGGFAAYYHASHFNITFTNECSAIIDLYTSLANISTDGSESIVPGRSVVKTIGRGHKGHFRNGLDEAATLIEIFSESLLRKVWYAISIIPSDLNPGFEFCKSLDECKQNSESCIGFNTPIQITPMSNTNGENCRELTCLTDGCEDAYNFPNNDIKTHSCPFGTNFQVTFCPAGDVTEQGTTFAGSSVTGKETTQASETTIPVTVDVMATGYYSVQGETAYGQSDGVVPEVTKKSDTGAAETDTYAPKAEATLAEVTPSPSTASKYCV